MNNNRLIMAKHIMTHRVLQGEELRTALVWRMQEFLEVVYGPAERWFMLTIEGWELTEEGREGLLHSFRRPHPRRHVSSGEYVVRTRGTRTARDSRSRTASE